MKNKSMLYTEKCMQKHDKTDAKSAKTGVNAERICFFGTICV